jgi:hypothetical protein
MHRMLRVMLVDNSVADDSDKEVSQHKGGLEAAGYDVVVVLELGPALAERVAELRAGHHHRRHRIADARRARADIGRQRKEPATDRSLHRRSRQHDHPGRRQSRRFGVRRRRNARRPTAADSSTPGACAISGME